MSYSLFVHLAEALFLEPDRPVGMLTGYYDASGHRISTHTLVVSGHLSTVEKWKQFDLVWADTLRSAGIKTYFRMSDLMAKKPPYDNWSDQARADLLRALISHLKDAAMQGFAESVATADWVEANKAYALEENWCVPYSLAAFFVMDRSVRWWGKEHDQKGCLFIFEDGDDGYGKFVQMMENLIARSNGELKPCRPIPGNKKIAALQAADMCAWPRRVANDLIETEAGMRVPLPDIIHDQIMRIPEIPCVWGGVSSEHIVSFCADHDVPKRGEARRWTGLGGSTAQGA